ncbi:translation elongation factor Ts [Candidatus Nomurabacteria bacterium RIFCSPHIGHO2_02_FULL_41_18]|uniref:Elongation factor Ts n=1 Tax=Candidatus Nomurabacteria bacterium RIFCSPHIGHO2_02_FULL_41_18 TaxID=1801754 RepID=A0A1F6W731_9BACT|nr:MAG: translation elongation factor Ts [Candidatus Nomurabacteria bacterium RIFCSPHIGHO2_01_FULL_41_71]OGI77701.1 MAG: translation elongation factor Ts [Candidatus Nomurabacteria bacterium RIFCSPHIGHO2_02_FULL_41_18]OGI89971.1 MAG: translation elongation factor Ts [Candidatus Nomurabacteria bacterium RIFCSPLOWO2_01_FULL_41_52b]OGJ00483.1 MAG: translation elongation factor Ts [Candidatus Nomurabacteria bacterium RIFCSPLOWO2_02_FULL_41_9]
MPEIAITAELVKELRDATGISIMQCRKALLEAEGDMEKALLVLKKNSAEVAQKKADRETKDGRVAIKQKGRKSVLVALHCETDFVAKNEDFINLLEILSEKAFSNGAEKTKILAKDLIDPVIQKTGENIILGEIYELEGSTLGNYVHNNKSAVMVSLDGGTSELAKDIAMHVAAIKPEYIKASDIGEEARRAMTEIFQKEVSKINKEEEIKKKMLQGKISAYFKERTLLDQPFVKNPEETIGRLLEKNNASVKEIKKYSI